MILHVYTITETESNRCASTVFTAVNDETAMKRFKKTIEDWKKENMITETMRLIHIGMYETETVRNKDEKGLTISLEPQLYGSRDMIYIVGEGKDINKDDIGKCYGDLTEKETYQRLFGRML